MGLGSRHARIHDTAAAHDSLARHAVFSEDFADYAVGERVITREGFIGSVDAIDDGPFPGTESYRITLEGGLGGGDYATRDIIGRASALDQRAQGSTQSQAAQAQAAQATVQHATADLDYPELGDILTQRPDIARS